MASDSLVPHNLTKSLPVCYINWEKKVTSNRWVLWTVKQPSTTTLLPSSLHFAFVRLRDLWFASEKENPPVSYRIATNPSQGWKSILILNCFAFGNSSVNNCEALSVCLWNWKGFTNERKCRTTTTVKNQRGDNEWNRQTVEEEVDFVVVGGVSCVVLGERKFNNWIDCYVERWRRKKRSVGSSSWAVINLLVIFLYSRERERQGSPSTLNPQHPCKCVAPNNAFLIPALHRRSYCCFVERFVTTTHKLYNCNIISILLYSNTCLYRGDIYYGAGRRRWVGVVGWLNNSSVKS